MTTPQYQSYGGTPVAATPQYKPTPQYQAYGGTTARTNSSPASRLDVFKKPLDPSLLAKVRKKKVKVLEEDEFSDRVEQIIERDFFPELEKLKAQSDYIDAKDKDDFVTMNRLQEKYSGCRPGTGLRRLTSPATFETPEEPAREFDPRRPNAQGVREGSVAGSSMAGSSVAGDEDPEEKDVDNLDKFLANHTSEDNESFVELQIEAEKAHRLNKAWMYKEELTFLEDKAEQMRLPSIEEQCALPIKPLEVDGWTYQNINSVFHNPDTLELSYEEKLDQAKKSKEIKHDNTRISKLPWKSDKQMELMRREAERQREVAMGKVGPDGNLVAAAETPMVNGYKMMSMAPSPALGVTDSPLMTWGEVESTPYRLEGCETPLLSVSQGTGFSIKDVPARDRIAKELADKNIRSFRERKQKALQQVKTSLKVGRPNSGRPASGLPTLSPAAKRLVSTKLGIRLGTDDMLRASYTPSPRRSSATPTPRGSSVTPNQKRKTTSSSKSKSSTPRGDKAARPRKSGAAEEQLNINTDNLLNIGGGATKRQRAQDFFMKPTDSS